MTCHVLVKAPDGSSVTARALPRQLLLFLRDWLKVLVSLVGAKTHASLVLLV